MVNNTKIKIIIIMKEKQIRVCAADYKCTCNEIFIECINIYIISWMLCIVISIKGSYELPNILILIDIASWLSDTVKPRFELFNKILLEMRWTYKKQ